MHSNLKDSSNLAILDRQSRKSVGVVTEVLAALPTADMLVCKFAISDDTYKPSALAINPYPPSEDSTVSFFEENAQTATQSRIVAYTTSAGREAKVGTYDRLSPYFCVN